jgi:hypothetical protein
MSVKNDQSPLKMQIPNQGWKQFLTARDEMLAAYDKAKILSSKRAVQTAHGIVAEAEFRKWLNNFLPKRYGVTAGYIISQGMPNSEHMVHYDVIIYDQLESPVLWVDENPDTSPAGRSLAIPVEYVRGVIEVKSAFKKPTVEMAVQQLGKLKPLMAFTEPSNHPFKLYLPMGFFCATVFFELRKEDEMDFAALDALMEASKLRGFYGGYILRANTLDKYYSGKLSLIRESEDSKPWNKSLFFWSTSKSVKVGEKMFLKAQLHHSETHFSEFAFDIIALLKGSYHPNVLSSLYGMGTTDLEAGHAASVTYYNPDDVKRHQDEIERFFRNPKNQ